MDKYLVTANSFDDGHKLGWVIDAYDDNDSWEVGLGTVIGSRLADPDTIDTFPIKDGSIVYLSYAEKLFKVVDLIDAAGETYLICKDINSYPTKSDPWAGSFALIEERRKL